jgi:hypothetical protein
MPRRNIKPTERSGTDRQSVVTIINWSKKIPGQYTAQRIPLGVIAVSQRATRRITERIIDIFHRRDKRLYLFKNDKLIIPFLHG